MCGIAGFISSAPLPKKQAKTLCSALLYYSQERGQQSAGIFVNDLLIKKATSAANFIQSAEFHNAFDKNPSLAIMHTRQPTSGGQTSKHAQPFRKNATITIHNGMYSDCEALKKKWAITKSVNVDSELVTQFIDSYGIDRLPDFIDSTDGPSAIAAIYRDNLYLMRSSNPTSHTILTFDGNSILAFASTKDILERSLLRCWLLPRNLSFEQTKDGILYHATATGLSALTEKSVSHSWRNKSWNRSSNNWSKHYLEGELPDDDETIITNYKKYMPHYKAHAADCNCLSCKLPHTEHCLCASCEAKRLEARIRQGNLEVD